MTGALLEEGLRGAGGRLLNARGERYMERYDPKRGTLDARRRRARRLHGDHGRPGTPNGGVLIDVSHLGADVVERTSAAWSTAAATSVSIWRARPSRSARPPTSTWAASHRRRLPHRSRRPVRRRRRRRRRPRRQSPRRQRRGRLHRLRRHRRRRDGRLGGGPTRLRRATVRGGRVGATGAGSARASGGGEDLYALQRRLRDVMWEQVGLIRSGAGLTQALGAIDEMAERSDAACGCPAGPSSTSPGRTGSTSTTRSRRGAAHRAVRAGAGGEPGLPLQIGLPRGRRPRSPPCGCAPTAPRPWCGKSRSRTRYRPDAAPAGVTVEVGD